MRRKAARSYNLAEAKKRLSELVCRVAFGGESVIIMRRGRPMAKLVPPDEERSMPHLADVAGWLDDDDPLFGALDDIVLARARHTPRVVRAARRAKR